MIFRSHLSIFRGVRTANFLFFVWLDPKAHWPARAYSQTGLFLSVSGYKSVKLRWASQRQFDEQGFLTHHSSNSVSAEMPLASVFDVFKAYRQNFGGFFV